MPCRSDSPLWKSALPEFEQVIGVDPQYPDYRFDRANLLRMGRPAMALKDYEAAMRLTAPDAAIADLNRALEHQPGNSEVLFNRGRAHEAVGMHSEAIADYRAALGYAGADQEALLDGLARCESALGIGEDSPK